MQVSFSENTSLPYTLSDIVVVNPTDNPIPRLKIVDESPVVTTNEVTAMKATLDVTPAWFEPVKAVPEHQIRFPANYNRNSPVDVRTYNCLATYRSMTNKTDQVDFVAEPFNSSVESAETLVVILNELAHQLGARLTFSNAAFEYDDSAYRAACGVGNLGSIHSFLASEGAFETAKFHLHFKLDYDQIKASPQTLNNFVLTLINDLSTLAQCKKEFIRVFSIARVSSIAVELGITTPQLAETIRLADLLRTNLNQLSSSQRQGLLQYLFSERYNYTLEPALAFLQLQESDFDPRFNRAYPNAQEEKRGGYPYYFPEGWYRHALRVIGKYPGDQVWLGMNNSPGEWAVAYHGTQARAAKGIADQGLLHAFVTADACAAEAKRNNPTIPDVKGLYVATHCEKGASGYAASFTVADSSGATKTYQIVFQCRVQPGKFTEHRGPVQSGMAWRVFDEKAIRPYGLLLKNA